MMPSSNLNRNRNKFKTEAEEDGTQRRGYSKNICGRHGHLYSFDEV